MTIGSVHPVEVPQTLLQGSGPMSSPSAPQGAKGGSFAEALAKIASEQMALDELSGSQAGSLGSQSSGLGSTGSSSVNSGVQAELNLISMLISGQQNLAPSVTGSGASNLATSGPSGQEVVLKASQLAGTPYVWGGTSPKGFDCSGFTQYVYGELGVSLPRTSEQQAKAGISVPSLSSAQPGDLVFFAGSDGTAKAPGHVGIYVGNGEMIDAPYTGKTVELQPVSSAGPVVAIRRVLPNSSSSLPDVSIGHVRVPSEYASIVENAAAANGIPPTLLASLLSQESGFNPSATSSAGAQGIAQFMPSTAAGMGIDSANPTQAINAAAKLIASYSKDFGSYSSALAAYNAGPEAVAKYGGIPPYPETQAYVANILSMAGLSGSKGGQ